MDFAAYKKPRLKSAGQNAQRHAISSIRTVPSVAESHRILRSLADSWQSRYDPPITAGGEFHPTLDLTLSVYTRRAILSTGRRGRGNTPESKAECGLRGVLSSAGGHFGANSPFSIKTTRRTGAKICLTSRGKCDILKTVQRRRRRRLPKRICRESAGGASGCAHGESLSLPSRALKQE